MQPRCGELEDPHRVSLPLDLGAIFMEYPEPSGNVPAHIRDWMLQYQCLREEWKLLEVYRSEFCDNWR